MTPPLPIDVSRRAAAQIEEAAAWWAQNRPLAPGAIQEELQRAFALISIQPGIGARALNPRLTGVRRIHPSRIHYRLYYRARGRNIEVLAFWHTSRGSDPRL